MTRLLDRVAPRCCTPYIEQDWEEECKRARKLHPWLTFAGALAVTGIGMVFAVVLFTVVAAVPLYMLMGIL